MLFKEIKQNYPVYILDKQRLKLVQGKVATVSFPRLDMNALLAELNPAYKEKRETEERLCNLETGIHTLQGMMSELMNNFKKE